MGLQLASVTLCRCHGDHKMGESRQSSLHTCILQSPTDKKFFKKNGLRSILHTGPSCTVSYCKYTSVTIRTYKNLLFKHSISTEVNLYSRKLATFLKQFFLYGYHCKFFHSQFRPYSVSEWYFHIPSR